MAYLNFVEGSLANNLAHKLDSARAPFKNLRDAENALTPRRNIRSGLALQISRIEHEQQKGTEKRLAELKEQLRIHEKEDEYKEKQVEILKRRAVKESEQQKWDAIREVCVMLVYTINANLYIFIVRREACARVTICNPNHISAATLSSIACSAV